MGIRDTKSPYELRKENLLPRFGGAPRVHSSERDPSMVQEDWVERQGNGNLERDLNKGGLLSPALSSERRGGEEVEADPAYGNYGTQGTQGARAAFGSTELMTGGNPFTKGGSGGVPVRGGVRVRRQRGWLNLLTFGLLGRVREQQPLVQAELSLDRIKVVRNDLADSDLELVLKKKKKVPPGGSGGKAEAPPRWSRLTARLFEMGQEH